MITRAINKPQSDIFNQALLLAALLHLVLLLGVNFVTEENKPQLQQERQLDITLVQPQQQPEPKPDRPELLANQNQAGSAKTPAEPKARQAPTPQAEQQQTKIVPKPKPAIAEPKPKRITTQAPSPHRQPIPTEKSQPIQPTSSQLLAGIRQAAQLTETERHPTQSRKPWRKHISASTQEYKYATYLDAWRRKVERIGNLNYPEEAKRRKIYGNLMLTVSLYPDGSIEQIRVARSSGHKLLDDAAIRIVRLAAPFAPFPPAIRAETDRLEITRTWQFLSNYQLFAK